MKRLTAFGILTCLGVLTGCQPQEVSMDGAQKPAPAPELAHLNAFVGEWTEDFTCRVPDSKEEMKMTSSVKFEWALDGYFLRGTWSGDFQGQKMTGEGFYWWDPRDREYEFIWFDNTGHSMEGEMTYHEKRGEWRMRWEGEGHDGKPSRGEGTMTMPDAKTIMTTMTEWDALGLCKKMSGSGKSTKK
ncbi:MAG: hypothetical protein CHACPFDD_00155 [Phycisphaerae bacterium]|nr:hypothetical protein [Phycisphaerae bacterium]